MSFLYPRLLVQQEKPLYEDFQNLTVAELTARVATSHESAVYVATGGDRVSTGRLGELRAAVVDLAKEAGFPNDSSRASNADFDLRLAALLHAEMGMVPAEAAARDVWAFLALVLLPDVAYWRYPGPPRDRVLGTDLTRHVFGRLWWRAQLVHAPDSTDPYAALGILGEAAFDQIYARRAALGGSPHLVRGILRVWENLDLLGLNEREILRDFLKRLLRLAPFVLFDGVEEDALDDELHAVAQESVDARRFLSAAPEDVDIPQIEPVPPYQEAVRTEASETVESTPEEEPPRSWFAPRPVTETPRLKSLEICAGAGAQALGLEHAGFDPVLVIDSKPDACGTIHLNRPQWHVLCQDLAHFDPSRYPHTVGVDLLSGGLPRVKSMATTSRAEDTEERRVLKMAIKLAESIRPKALLLENVPRSGGKRRLR